MHPVLRLWEDFLTDRGVLSLPALPRMLYVVRGAVMAGTRPIAQGEAWHGEDAVTVRASEAGATFWRWDLSTGTPARLAQRRRASIRATARGAARDLAGGRSALARRQRGVSARRLRLSAPPSGSRHPLPGRGRTARRYRGQSHTYQVGDAWYEAGPIRCSRRPETGRPVSSAS